MSFWNTLLSWFRSASNAGAQSIQSAWAEAAKKVAPDVVNELQKIADRVKEIGVDVATAAAEKTATKVTETVNSATAALTEQVNKLGGLAQPFIDSANTQNDPITNNNGVQTDNPVGTDNATATPNDQQPQQ